MKLTDLFEADPYMAQLLSKTAQGIGQAAGKLKGPITKTQLQNKVAQSIKDLEKSIADPKNKGRDFKSVFQDHLKTEKESAGIQGKMGFQYDTKKLQNPDGSFNSAHIRKVLSDFFSQFRSSAGISRKVAGINVDPKDKFLPIGTVKKGSDGQDYQWQGAQWSNVKTGKMAGAKLP